MSQFTQKSQWDYLYDGLIKAFPGLKSSDNTVFQYSAAPQPADWDTPTDWNAFQFADNQPANLDGNYSPGDGQIHQAYRDFINSIEPSNFEKNQDYKDRQVHLEDLENEIKVANEELSNTYHTWRDQNPEDSEGITLQTWRTDVFLGKEFGDHVMNLYRRKKIVDDEITQLVSAFNEPLAEARKNANDGKFEVKVHLNGVENDLPLTTVNPPLAELKTRWDGRAAGEYELDITINKEVTIDHPWQRIITRTSHGNCVHSSSSSTEHLQRIVNDEKYELKVQAVGAQVLDIERGDWFNADWLSQAGSVGLVGGIGSNFTMDSFFGEKGLLNLVPTQLFVIYKPRVVLTITTATYEETIKQWEHQGSYGILGIPFQVDSSGGGSGMNVEQLDSGTTVIKMDSFNATNVQPLVLGVVSYNHHRS